MRTLGEQWIEDGRMYKAVLKGSGNYISCSWTGLQLAEGLIAIDLGPVNEDGCLAEERTGLFPGIKHTLSLETFRWEWVAELRTESIYILIKAPTRQEVIDIWNRRA